MSNPIIQAIEEQLLQRESFRRVTQFTAGAIGEVQVDCDETTRQCVVRYVHPRMGLVDRVASVIIQDHSGAPLPKAGDLVWVSFVGGDPGAPIIGSAPLIRGLRQTSAPSLPGVTGA